MPKMQIRSRENPRLTTITSDVLVTDNRPVIVFTLNRFALRRNLRSNPRPQTEVSRGAGSHLRPKDMHHPIHRERIALVDRWDLREITTSNAIKQAVLFAKWLCLDMAR
jgi:hypothetical protein